MKVLIAPDTDNWTQNVSCNKCTAELEINVKDISSSYYIGDQRDPSYYSHSVICPICKNSISISSNKMTPAVKAHCELQADKKKSSSGSYWDR